MPHIFFQTPRMAPAGCPSVLPTDKNISLSVIRVIVKTPGKQRDFMVAEDTLVRQFKEKLSAYFKCQMDQLVLVFMGRLLKDHDTLSQRGILDGHTIHLVIKSKQGSRSLAHSSRSLLTREPCYQDRNGRGNSSGAYQPAGVSHTPVDLAPSVEPVASQVHTQHLEVESPENTAQVLENPSIQQLLSNTDLMIQLISEHPDMQQLMQQNPEVSHILNNSDTLWQMLELARNLAMIQEILQIQPPAQNLEQPLNPPSQLDGETISGGSSTLGQSHADSNDQMLNSSQDPFKGNIFTALLGGQVLEQVQSSSPSPPSPPERQDQLLKTQVIHTSSCCLSSITSDSATPNKVNHTSRANAATNSRKGQSHTCAIQQPAEVPTLPSIEITQQPQAEHKDATISLDSSDQRLEDEQTSSQIAGSMMQLLLNNPYLAAQMMSFMSMAWLSEQWRQQLPTVLQQTQLSDILTALANPKASQAILKIEQGLQLLATEAPVILPWVAPYLWVLGWLPAPSCSYADAEPWAWDVPDMAKPKGPECGHKSGGVLQKLQSLAGDPSHLPQAPEVRFSKQMDFLQAIGFENHHANLEALIATEGDTSAAIRKLKRSQGF